MSSPRPVAGRTALVTGAGNGLGRAIAHTLAVVLRVVLAGRVRDKRDVVAAELAGSASGCRVVTVDVSDQESV